MKDEIDRLNGKLDRANTAILWLAEMAHQGARHLSMEDWRDMAMKLADELHDHIDIRDGLTDEEFETKKKDLDAQYADLQKRWQLWGGVKKRTPS
jgi:hypothetical protein